MRKLIPLDEAMTDRLGGIGRTTLYKLIDDGALVRVNIGRRAFVTGESIDAYIDGLAAKAGRA